jgi:hypothetical protein
MYGYIYKTTNLINNKIYLGQRKGKFDATYFGSGLYLKRALEKYGINSFRIEVLIYAETREQLNNLEIEYIAKYRSLFPNEGMYNIANGGGGGLGVHHSGRKKGFTMSEAERMKRSETLKKKDFPFRFKKGQVAWNKNKKLGFMPVGAFRKGHATWNKGLKGIQPWMNTEGLKLGRLGHNFDKLKLAENKC